MTRPEETHDEARATGPDAGAGEHHAQPHDFTGPLSPGVKRLLKVFGTLCVLLFVVDFFIERKTHAPGESFPGFYAIYGFVGCVFLVLAAKLLRKLVMRDEDYWDRRADPEGRE